MVTQTTITSTTVTYCQILLPEAGGDLLGDGPEPKSSMSLLLFLKGFRFILSLFPGCYITIDTATARSIVIKDPQATTQNSDSAGVTRFESPRNSYHFYMHYT